MPELKLPREISDFLLDPNSQMKRRMMELPPDLVDPRVLENLQFQEKYQGLQDALAPAAPFLMSPALTKGMPLPMRILDFLTAGSPVSDETLQAVVPTPTKALRKIAKLQGKIRSQEITPNTLMHDKINRRDELFHATGRKQISSILNSGKLLAKSPYGDPAGVSFSRVPEILPKRREIRLGVAPEAFSKIKKSPITDPGFAKTRWGGERNPSFEFETRTNADVPLNQTNTTVYPNLNQMSYRELEELVQSLQPGWNIQPLIGNDPRTSKPAVMTPRLVEILLGAEGKGAASVPAYRPKPSEINKWTGSTPTFASQLETKPLSLQEMFTKFEKKHPDWVAKMNKEAEQLPPYMWKSYFQPDPTPTFPNPVKLPAHATVKEYLQTNFGAGTAANYSTEKLQKLADIVFPTPDGNSVNLYGPLLYVLNKEAEQLPRYVWKSYFQPDPTPSSPNPIKLPAHATVKDYLTTNFAGGSAAKYNNEQLTELSNILFPKPDGTSVKLYDPLLYVLKSLKW